MSTDAQHAPDPVALIDGVHVVILHSRTANGGHRWTRRPYFNLPAAQRALDRATMRGDEAHLILCRITPIPGHVPALDPEVTP